MPCRHLGLAGRRKHGCGRRPVRAPECFSRLLAAMRQKNPRDWRTCLMPRLRRESIEKLTAIRVWSVAIVHMSWRANPASSAGKFLSRNQTSTIYSIANVMSHSRRRKENGQKREYLPITSPHFPTKTRPSGERPCTACGDGALPWPERRERAPSYRLRTAPSGQGCTSWGAQVCHRGRKGSSPTGQRCRPRRRGRRVGVCGGSGRSVGCEGVAATGICTKKGSMCGLYGKKPYLCATLVTQ